MERCFASAAVFCLLSLAFLYFVVFCMRINGRCDPPPGYWRRRLLLNMGMWIALALGISVAMLLESGDALAWPLMLVAAGVDALYAALIILWTPRDWWHALPVLAAVACYAAAWFVV